MGEQNRRTHSLNTFQGEESYNYDDYVKIGRLSGGCGIGAR